MSIEKYIPQEVVYDQKEIMPYGKLGNFIDWNKVFKKNIGVSYPKPINRNKAVDEKGNFDAEKFLLSRSGLLEKRENYLGKIEQNIARFEELHQLDRLDFYSIVEGLESIIQGFKDMFFLGKEGSEEVYEKDFFTNLKELLEQIREKKSLSGNTGYDSLINDIKKNIEKGLAREKKEWEICIDKNKKSRDNSLKKYVKEDKSLDVDSILKDINSNWDWNETIMLVAFYVAKCDKNDLKKLQDGVIAVLNNNIKILDTYKVFVILERILPYIQDDFKINWDLPEIFRPEYLSYISIHDLDLDTFISQVKYNGKELNRSEEIQDKLIEQFKQFGQSESGKIGFGQGSEQLFYRNGVTSAVNQKNFKDYMVNPDVFLGYSKMPVPNILNNDKSDTTSDDLFNELNA